VAPSAATGSTLFAPPQRIRGVIASIRSTAWDYDNGGEFHINDVLSRYSQAHAI